MDSAIQLTPDQSAAITAIKVFLRDAELDAFVLRGSAGTGKTTLIAKLVDELEAMNLSCALLAPTGRAARILGNKIKLITGNPEHEGSTIHRAIYSLSQIDVNEDAETANDPGLRMTFPLRQDESLTSLFVIDESSMVGDREAPSDFMQFGTGRLLSDIVTYARLRRPGRETARLSKLLFVGDPAQLPPVGENTSPALSDLYLSQEFKLKVASFDLNAVMRQAADSAILERATALRDALLAGRFNTFSLKPNGHDIERVDAQTAVDLVVEGIRAKQTTVTIVHSNAKALEYNRSVRDRRWGDATLPIQVNETLLVNKNSPTHLMSNGDLVKVTSVAPEAEVVPVYLRGGHQVELFFRPITVAFRDANGSVIHTSCLALENLLDSPIRELTPLEQRALLVDFRKRHPDLHPKSAEFRRTIVVDPYFNAIQVKYGYAMTCHKAQGGEWDVAVVDFESNAGARSASFFRWAYTAITRAVKKLVVVNPPDFTPMDNIFKNRPKTVATTSTAAVDQEATTDPDWNKFSFSVVMVPLMAIHRQLRAVWKAQGIDIEQLQHLQYCERYTLVHGGGRATVQYHYNGKYQIKSAGLLPNTRSDHALASSALTSVHALINRQGDSATEPDEFIQAFLTRLDAALAGSTIKRIGFRTMPYRLRVSVSDTSRKGDIDFTYDGTSTWTAAQEVGGLGNTGGLYDEIRALMEAEQERVS